MKLLGIHQSRQSIHRFAIISNNPSCGYNPWNAKLSSIHGITGHPPNQAKYSQVCHHLQKQSTMVAEKPLQRQLEPAVEGGGAL